MSQKHHANSDDDLVAMVSPTVANNVGGGGSGDGVATSAAAATTTSSTAAPLVASAASSRWRKAVTAVQVARAFTSASSLPSAADETASEKYQNLRRNMRRTMSRRPNLDGEDDDVIISPTSPSPPPPSLPPSSSSASAATVLPRKRNNTTVVAEQQQQTRRTQSQFVGGQNGEDDKKGSDSVYAANIVVDDIYDDDVGTRKMLQEEREDEDDEEEEGGSGIVIDVSSPQPNHGDGDGEEDGSNALTVVVTTPASGGDDNNNNQNATTVKNRTTRGATTTTLLLNTGTAATNSNNNNLLSVGGAQQQKQRRLTTIEVTRRKSFRRDGGPAGVVGDNNNHNNITPSTSLSGPAYEDSLSLVAVVAADGSAALNQRASTSDNNNGAINDPQQQQQAPQQQKQQQQEQEVQQQQQYAASNIFSCVSCRRAITIEPFSVSHFVQPRVFIKHHSSNDEESGVNQQNKNIINNSKDDKQESFAVPPRNEINFENLFGPSRTLCVRYGEDLSIMKKNSNGNNNSNGIGGDYDNGGNNNNNSYEQQQQQALQFHLLSTSTAAQRLKSTNPTISWQEAVRILESNGKGTLYLNKIGGNSNSTNKGGAAGNAAGFGNNSQLQSKKLLVNLTFWRKRLNVQLLERKNQSASSSTTATNSHRHESDEYNDYEDNNEDDNDDMGGDDDRNSKRNNRGGGSVAFGAGLKHAPFTIPPAQLAEIQNIWNERIEAYRGPLSATSASSSSGGCFFNSHHHHQGGAASSSVSFAGSPLGCPALISNHKINYGLISQSVLSDVAVGVDVTACSSAITKYHQQYLKMMKNKTTSSNKQDKDKGEGKEDVRGRIGTSPPVIEISSTVTTRQQEQQEQEQSSSSSYLLNTTPHRLLVENACAVVMPFVATAKTIQQTSGGEEIKENDTNDNIDTNSRAAEIIDVVTRRRPNVVTAKTTTPLFNPPTLTAANWAGQQASHLPATATTIITSSSAAAAPNYSGHSSDPNVDAAHTPFSSSHTVIPLSVSKPPKVSAFASSSSNNNNTTPYATNSAPPFTSGFNLDRTIVKEALQYNPHAVIVPIAGGGRGGGGGGGGGRGVASPSSASTATNVTSSATPLANTNAVDDDNNNDNRSNDLADQDAQFREVVASMATITRGGHTISPDLLRDSDEALLVESIYKYKGHSARMAVKQKEEEENSNDKENNATKATAGNSDASPTAMMKTTTTTITTPIIALKTNINHRIQRRRLLALYETISEQAGGVDLPLCATCNNERSVSLQQAIVTLRQKIHTLTDYLIAFDQMAAAANANNHNNNNDKNIKSVVSTNAANETNSIRQNKKTATTGSGGGVGGSHWNAACQEAHDISILLLGAGGVVGRGDDDDSGVKNERTNASAAAADLNSTPRSSSPHDDGNDQQKKEEEERLLDDEIEELHRELQALVVQEKSELDVTETTLIINNTTNSNLKAFEQYAIEGERWLENGFHRTETSLKNQTALMRAFRFDISKSIAMINDLRIGKQINNSSSSSSSGFFGGGGGSGNSNSSAHAAALALMAEGEPPTNEEINCGCGFLLQLVSYLATKRQIYNFSKPYKLIYRGSQSVIEYKAGIGSKTETYDFHLTTKLFFWNTFGQAWVAFAVCVGDIVNHFERKIYELRTSVLNSNKNGGSGSGSSSSSSSNNLTPPPEKAAAILKEIPSMPSLPISSDGTNVGGYNIKYGAANDEQWTIAVRHLMILLDWCVKVEGKL